MSGATSVFPGRLEVGIVRLDCLLMIPAAAADGLVRAGRGLVDCRLGVTKATATESRTAPGRELIDGGRSVVQRAHWQLLSPKRFLVRCCARLVLLWLLIPISFELPPMQHA